MKINNIWAISVAIMAVSLYSCNSQPDITLEDHYQPNNILNTVADSTLAAHCYNGTFIGHASGDVVAFKGIPYAKPPVGELRWKAPQRPDTSAQIHEAYYYSKSPIQTRSNSILGSYNEIGEDCLYLNVWKNRSDTSTHKPVMVYIHGGSYGWGSSADPLYDGENLVKRHPDIVIATIGYRLGMMGFIDFSGVNGGNEYADATNVGLLDQVAALQWIKENITAFGGDPENITVFGESAGAGSISILSVMPQTKGLYQKAILESGNIAMTYSKDESLPLTEKLIELTGAKSMTDLIAIPENEIIAINEKLNSYANFPQRDGRIVPSDLYDAYRNGAAKDIKMIIGSNSDESRYWLHTFGSPMILKMGMQILFENNTSDFSDEDINKIETFMATTTCEDGWELPEFYNELMFRLPALQQAEYQSENGADVYMYYWRYPASIPNYGASHISELSYVFGNLDVDIYTGSGNLDTLLSNRIQDIWVNFARTGTPTDGTYTMSKYNTTLRATTFFNSGNDITTEIKPLDTQRELLSPSLKYNVNGNFMHLSLNVPFVWKAAGVILLCIGTIVAVPIVLRRRKRSIRNATEPN